MGVCGWVKGGRGVCRRVFCGREVRRHRWNPAVDCAGKGSCGLRGVIAGFRSSAQGGQERLEVLPLLLAASQLVSTGRCTAHAKDDGRGAPVAFPISSVTSNKWLPRTEQRQNNISWGTRGGQRWCCGMGRYRRLIMGAIALAYIRSVSVPLASIMAIFMASKLISPMVSPGTKNA
eukprot:1335943-Rhodomonas_salina.2